MAIDSAQKRHSAIHPNCPWRSTVPIPGTIDQADRQQLAYVYSGISAGVLVIYSAVTIQPWIWDVWGLRAA